MLCRGKKSNGKETMQRTTMQRPGSQSPVRTQNKMTRKLRFARKKTDKRRNKRRNLNTAPITDPAYTTHTLESNSNLKKPVGRHNREHSSNLTWGQKKIEGAPSSSLVLARPTSKPHRIRSGCPKAETAAGAHGTQHTTEVPDRQAKLGS